MQGIARGLSISEDITSPTFALSHHYKSGKIPLIHLDLYRLENISSAKEFYFSGKIPLIHLDLYRLENNASAKEIFLSEEEEALQSQAILVVEWPELIEPLIENFWKVEISYAKNSGRNYEIRDPKNLLTFS